MAELIVFKCPSCGGKLEFNAGQQEMVCPFCDSAIDVAALQAMDAVLNEQQANAGGGFEAQTGEEWSQGETAGMRVYHCQTCGGEVMADETTSATTCPYCDNPVVMSGQLSGDLKPELVIPFKLDKEAAKKALMQHMSGKFLLPKVFSSENHIDEIKGVYVPVWLFEAGTDSQMLYKGEKTRRWSDNKFDYVEHKYYSAVRAGTMSFENVPVDGSSKMDDTMMESLEPFDMKDAQNFSMAYLSGYLADKYDVSAEDNMPHAEERMQESVRSAFEETLREYDHFERQSESINFSEGKVRYVLYPVWLLNTSWNGTNYHFGMNGQTGKFVGDLPIDKAKATLTFLIATAIAGALSFLIGSKLAKNGLSIVGIIVCILIALLIGGLVLAGFASSLKSVRAEHQAENYIKEKLNLSQKNDRYLYTKVEKTARPQQQSQNN